jgi:hypothetical protein
VQPQVTIVAEQASVESWWVLGFTYDAVVDAWQDARLAAAVERTWADAGRPDDVDVWWAASADDYAFRWYLNGRAAELLDAAQVTWRGFVVGRAEGPPADARCFLHPPVAMPDGGLGS